MDDVDRIIAKIDPSTVAGHNLRALLLRLLDGDEWRGCIAAADTAEFHRLACNFFTREPFELTQLGREVAEQLRPLPWTSTVGDASSDLATKCDAGTLLDPSGQWVADFVDARLAERCAAALSADDLRADKAYRVE